MNPCPHIGVLLTLATNLATASLALAQCVIPPPSPRPPQANAPTMPLVFLANQGQSPADASFTARHRSFTARLHDDRIVLQREHGDRGVALHLEFVGGRATPVAEDELPGRIHSLVGDRSAWRSLAACGAVRYPELWPGVDLVAHDRGGELEYDLVLQPEADLSQIAIRPLGADSVAIDPAGSLVLGSALGEVRQAAPTTWEVDENGTRHTVPCRFALRADGAYGFLVERHDASRRLVIDPILTWATYFGSAANDVDGLNEFGLAVDATGFVYIAGSTFAGELSVPFPTTAGAYRTSALGSIEGFVAKLDPSATGSAQLVWCTFLGGAGPDVLATVALTASGDVVVAGSSSSANFPATPGAFKTTLGVAGEGVLAVLSGNGATLHYATFLGGTPASAGNGFEASGLAVEPDGKIVVAGNTGITNMPTTAGAYQAGNAGAHDLWFGRLDRTQIGVAQLVWATYLGGAGNQTLSSICISPALPGIVTFVGDAEEAGTVLHDYVTGALGGYDWIVGQLDPAQTGVAQRRFVHLIGGGDDHGGGVAVLGNGEILTSGHWGSPSASRVFRLAPNGAFISYTTLFTACDAPNLSVSANGVVTVAGYAADSTVAVTPDAIDSTRVGAECYVCQLDATLTQILYATYIGGSDTDRTSPNCAHVAGNVLTLLMQTRSVDNLTTANAYQGANAGSIDLHIVRLDLPAGCGVPTASAGSDVSIPEGTLVTLDGSGSSTPCGQPGYAWTQVAGQPVALDLTDPVHPTFTAPLVPVGGATLTFQLVVNDGHQQTSEPDVVNVTVTNVNNPPVALAGDDSAVAEGSPFALDGHNSYDPDDEPLAFTWLQTAGPVVLLDLADPSRPAFTAPLVGSAGAILTFALTVNDGTDTDTDSVSVLVENVNHPPVADAGADQTRLEGTVVTLNGTGSQDPDADSLVFAWQQISGPSVTLASAASASANFTAPAVGTAGATLVFRLIVNDGYGGLAVDDVTVTVQDGNSPPVCSLAQPSVGELWPPNHKLVPITITGVTDPENSQITITILSVTQDEPINGLGDGDTGPDAVLQGGTVLLRAERAGGGNGRVYRVSFQASDGLGGYCTGQVQVCVPPSKGRNVPPCVDDGQNFNSAGS